jgi:excisionase family DNA binding protein
LEGNIERIAFRKSEAAKMLGLCLRTIDNMIGAKELTARRIGRRVLIPATALYALIGVSLKPDGKTERIAYAKAEAAEALGLSQRSIDNLIAARQLIARRIRGRVLIPVTSLHALMRFDRDTMRVAAWTAQRRNDGDESKRSF